VDGSECSFRVYLSEVENWCPLLPGRTLLKLNTTKVSTDKQDYETANMNYGLDGLMDKLRDPGQRKNYAWIRMRIHRLWSRWVKAARELEVKPAFHNRSQMRFFVYIGALSKASRLGILEDVDKGGPLGELVQWSDIISALYILGHELTITSEVEQLQAILAKFPSAESQCQSRERLPIDMIYTDIVGLTQFKRKVKNGYGKFSCLLRIIDSFGTEPAFNYEPYAKSHRLKTQWGMQNLNPQQMFTMFPHSPDNSFMGFVVENHINDTAEIKNIVRKDQALVYGKAEYMWQGKEDYLSIIQQYVEVHGTVFVDKPDSTVIPRYVKNHGILSGSELHTLLRETKLFIGLGFPYEGPAPLEAIAQGAIFINPKFSPAHNSQNTKFFKGKPTLRKLTSQHPYVEDFISEPHVYNVNINDPSAVKETIQKALQAHKDHESLSFLPYEYTEGGMIQRLNAYIEHQDFCGPHPPLWPPEGAVEVVLGQQGQSCKDVCWAHNKICEPSHFKRINSDSTLMSHVGPCTAMYAEDIFFPAYHTIKKICVLQKQLLLFSCVGEHNEYARLCPCRDYQKGQMALCEQC
jgi:alpha-1,3(6)-mannosylglycoprotein beta-1,6-N-acetyl-glucosaminyltransferase